MFTMNDILVLVLILVKNLVQASKMKMRGYKQLMFIPTILILHSAIIMLDICFPGFTWDITKTLALTNSYFILKGKLGFPWMVRPIEKTPICLQAEVVGGCSGHEVFSDVDVDSALIVSDPWGILVCSTDLTQSSV